VHIAYRPRASRLPDRRKNLWRKIAHGAPTLAALAVLLVTGNAARAALSVGDAGVVERYSKPFIIIFIAVFVCGILISLWRRPLKWSLDPETGESHLHFYETKEGSLVKRKTYSDRLTDYLHDKHELSQMRWQVPFTIVLTIACGYATKTIWETKLSWGPTFNPALGLLVLFMFPAVTVMFGGFAFIHGASWILAEILHIGAKNRLGPPPVTPRWPQDPSNDDPRGARQPTPQEMARRIKERENRGREPEFPA
jgi:hypothetical protein